MLAAQHWNGTASSSIRPSAQSMKAWCTSWPGTAVPMALMKAMVVASRDHPDKPVSGYIQKGDFIRLREISARYEVPDDPVAVGLENHAFDSQIHIVLLYRGSGRCP